MKFIYKNSLSTLWGLNWSFTIVSSFLQYHEGNEPSRSTWFLLACLKVAQSSGFRTFRWHYSLNEVLFDSHMSATIQIFNRGLKVWRFISYRFYPNRLSFLKFFFLKAGILFFYLYFRLGFIGYLCFYPWHPL